MVRIREVPIGVLAITALPHRSQPRAGLHTPPGMIAPYRSFALVILR